MFRTDIHLIDTDEIGMYKMAELRAILKENNIKIKGTRKADFTTAVLQLYIENEEGRLKIWGAEYAALEVKERKSYDNLLKRFQQAESDLTHCSLTQGKLADLSAQQVQKIAEAKVDPSLDSKEKKEVIAEVSSVVKQIQAEIKSIEQSKEGHKEKIAAIQEEHAQIPKAPPLLSVMLHHHTHTIKPSGKVTIQVQKLETILEDQKAQVKQLEKAKDSVFQNNQVPADVKQQQADILLNLIQDENKQISHTVQVQNAIGAGKGDLLSQIRAGHKLKLTSASQSWREKEEEENREFNDEPKLRKFAAPSLFEEKAAPRKFVAPRKAAAVEKEPIEKALNEIKPAARKFVAPRKVAAVEEAPQETQASSTEQKQGWGEYLWGFVPPLPGNISGGGRDGHRTRSKSTKSGKGRRASAKRGW
jgi:hypothetical protein